MYEKFTLVRKVQPIRWALGRFSEVQLICWDLDCYNWRKYTIDKIIRITVTEDKWLHKIEHFIRELPEK
ncbi:hypothetical protein D3C71_1196650 [compost metagenome]